MSSKLLTSLIVFVLSSSSTLLAGESMTHRLVNRFHAAWNANDLSAMLDQLQPTAVFKSPFQLRSGRTEIAETVLVRNPPRYREVEAVEHHSRLDDAIAWSIGHMTWRVDDESGNPTEETREADYLYVFTRHGGGDWKLDLLVFHE